MTMDLSMPNLICGNCGAVVAGRDGEDAIGVVCTTCLPVATGRRAGRLAEAEAGDTFTCDRCHEDVIVLDFIDASSRRYYHCLRCGRTECQHIDDCLCDDCAASRRADEREQSA